MNRCSCLLLFLLFSMGASAQIWRYPPDYLPYGDQVDSLVLERRKALRSMESCAIRYEKGIEVSRLENYQAFDAQGREITEAERFTDTSGSNASDTVRVFYDEHGFRLGMTVDGKRIPNRNIHYNAAGNVAAITTWWKDTLTAHFAYDAAGRIIRREDAPGNYETWDYDAEGRLSRFQRYANGQLAEELLYTHTPNVVSYTEETFFTLGTERRSAMTSSVGFFEGDRLVRIEHNDTDSKGAYQSVTESFFNADGSYSCISDYYAHNGVIEGTSYWTYARDAAGRLTEVELFVNGILVEQTCFRYVLR